MNLSVNTVAEIVRLAVAPVFLLSGICAFLNVCASRLSRIVDRSREVEPRLLDSRGAEHDRWLGELRVLDRRMSLVSWAISLSVLSGVLICAVVVLLFSASLSRFHVGDRHRLAVHRIDGCDRRRLCRVPGRDPGRHRAPCESARSCSSTGWTSRTSAPIGGGATVFTELSINEPRRPRRVPSSRPSAGARDGPGHRGGGDRRVAS